MYQLEGGDFRKRRENKRGVCRTWSDKRAERTVLEDQDIDVSGILSGILGSHCGDCKKTVFYGVVEIIGIYKRGDASVFIV